VKNIDDFGIPFYTSEDVCNLLYENPGLRFDSMPITDPEQYNQSVMQLYYDTPKLVKYTRPTVSVEEFDKQNQQQWAMPDEYRNFDIAEWLLHQCKTEEELQRVGQELMMYQDRGMFDLLRYMRYFVSVMRDKKVVWGVGRGSSVASYCLYLIGVHRINSIYYDLDIAEFLR
jgi:DNA polymerase III alpha subunit